VVVDACFAVAAISGCNEIGEVLYSRTVQFSQMFINKLFSDALNDMLASANENPSTLTVSNE
jgi:hypothetical protein